MASNRARPKDVLEIATPGGLAYMQYASRHPEYGDLIRVFPGLFRLRPTDFSKLVQEGGGYFAFYPVTAAVAQGLIEPVASESIPPGSEKPRLMRRPGARSNDGRVLSWLIIDGDREFLRQELTPDEKRLPIAVIWNHEILVQRLAEEWRPDQEG